MTSDEPQSIPASTHPRRAGMPEHAMPRRGARGCLASAEAVPKPAALAAAVLRAVRAEPGAVARGEAAAGPAPARDAPVAARL